MNVIDLFAGAGGLSEGFVQAGFNIVGQVEMNRSAVDTLKTRMLYHELRRRNLDSVYIDYVLGERSRHQILEEYDLQGIDNSVLCEKIDDNYGQVIKKLQKVTGKKRIDIIIGGPPCQAYSYIGRARDANKMRSDQRNHLYKYYIEFLNAFRPSIFVFENVPGLVSAGNGQYLYDMRQRMHRIGYETDYRILNASDYGVPQNRKRIIMIGWNKNSSLQSYPSFQRIDKAYAVKDFLNDLPVLPAGSNKGVMQKCKENPTLRKLGITKNSFNLIVNHVTRPHNKRDLAIYRRAVMLKRKGRNLRYNQLPARLKTHKNEESFLDRYKVIDIDTNESHTIVAHISKDGHFYIHPDIKQNRSLSVREAARLQTFPDDFVFEGSRTATYEQVGNAVPVMMARKIAETLKLALLGR